MKTRNEVREIALRIIYKINIFDDANVYYDVDDLIKEEYEVENDFVNSLVNGVIEKKDELTALVNKYMSDWSLKRLNKVDQALFLLASYELKYEKLLVLLVLMNGSKFLKNIVMKRLQKC